MLIMGKFTESDAKSGIVLQVKNSFQWPTGSENVKRKEFFLFCKQIFRHQVFLVREGVNLKNS